MESIEQNVRVFVANQEHLYRRLSVRECARIQTFPDHFVFHYDKVTAGYKMVGNAVPVRLAKFLALSIKQVLYDERFTQSKQQKAVQQLCEVDA
jgi:DNA (cytosine-5)-methyltransferase 1